MKHFLKLIFLLVVFTTKAQIPPDDENWDLTNLLIEDYFNGSQINYSKWEKVWGTWISEFDFNGSNVTVDNSSGENCVNLIATNNNSTGKPIHAGGIISKNNYGCGYYEIRCKIKCSGSSYMPAFWVMESDNCDCSSSDLLLEKNAYRIPHLAGCYNGWYHEIDFFETMCTPGSFNVSSNAHYYNGNCNHNNGVNLYSPHIINGNDLYNNFHVFGFEWTPGRVIFYLDGEPYRYLNSSLINTYPLRIWINMGFNGQVTDAIFPGFLYVDWVKVYSLKRDANAVVNTCQFNPSTFNYSLKKSITIGGSSCSSTLNQNDNVTLRATDYVTINGDFTVPLNSEFTILPTKNY